MIKSPFLLLFYTGQYQFSGLVSLCPDNTKEGQK